jgi:hypothetical protein
MLEPDKRPPSPVLYHIGFIVGLAEIGHLATRRSAVQQWFEW